MSCSGDEITYAPLAHLPRSMVRQRGLQKGNSASLIFTGFLQMGHFSLRFRLPAIYVLHDPGYVVVVVGFCDLAPVEFASLWFQPLGNVVHEYFAVNLRGVHGSAAFEQEIALF